MATPISVPLADVGKLLEESADRTAKRIVSELERVIAALSRKLEEKSNDSERVFAALMTVLSGAQKVQFKVAYEANGRKSSGQKSAPAWRETTPEDSSDDEESTPQLVKPWAIKRGLVSVTEGIRTLGLGPELSSSLDSKSFWDNWQEQPSGSIDHWHEEGEVLEDPYDDPDYDSEDPADSDSDYGDSDGSSDIGNYGDNDWADGGSDHEDGGGYYGNDDGRDSDSD